VIGLSITQVFIGESVFALALFLFNIPTGVFSDLVSRKKTLIYGQIMMILGVVIFAFAQNFWHVILSQIATGIGQATIQGTDSALLYDSLKALKREQEHKKHLGNITSFALLMIALGQIIGGMVGTVSLRLTVIACIPVSLMILFIACLFHEPKRETAKISAYSHVFSAFRWVLSHWMILLLVIAGVIVTFSKKISLHTFNPYMELINIPVFYWGILMAIFNLLAALVVKKAHLMESKLGSLNSYLMIFGVWIIGFVLMAKVNIILGFIWPVLLWTIRPLGDVFFSDEMNKRTDSHHRATVLSILGFSAQLFQVAALPVAGYLIDLYDLSTLYLMMAVILLVAGVVCGIGLYGKNSDANLSGQ
jgi:MFS family permease